MSCCWQYTLVTVLPVCSGGLYAEIWVFLTQWNRSMNGLCLSGQWMIYLPPTCLNYDNLSIKVKIMAADTWHFSFHSLPCWDTSLYLITVFHGNLEMWASVCVCVFNFPVLFHGLPHCLLHSNILVEATVWSGSKAICPGWSFMWILLQLPF